MAESRDSALFSFVNLNLGLFTPPTLHSPSLPNSRELLTKPTEHTDSLNPSCPLSRPKEAHSMPLEPKEAVAMSKMAGNVTCV